MSADGKTDVRNALRVDKKEEASHDDQANEKASQDRTYDRTEQSERDEIKRDGMDTIDQLSVDRDRDELQWT